MQVTETSSDGLARRLKVVLSAGELNERFTSRLDDLKDRVRLKGFRKGKVPLAHLKKVFGRELMTEVLQKAIEETSRQALAESKARPAVTPEIVVDELKDQIDRLIAGNSDFAYGLAFEALPEITLADFSSLKLEQLSADVDAAAIDQRLGRLIEQNVAYHADASRSAQDGDRVIIDFEGTIDGQPFEGGAAKEVPVVLGQGGFLAAIEAGLLGAKAGERRTIDAAFPTDYAVASLAGKAAVFDVVVNTVERPEKPALDDTFAKALGAQDVAGLREMVAQQLRSEYAAMSRQQLKRTLFDQLDKAYDFALPRSLIEREFDSIWQQMTAELTREGKAFEDEGTTEEEARAKYRQIAERRVRLGLTIAEIGQKNNIDVSKDEMRRGLIHRVRQFPGQEKAAYEYYEKSPGAMEAIRAPIFEDKVVDFILEQVKPSVRKVSAEELLTKSTDDS